MTVSDGHNPSVGSSVSVTVKSPAPPPTVRPENRPPRLLSFSYGPAEPQNDGRTVLTLTAVAGDEDGPDDLWKAVFDLGDLAGPPELEVAGGGNGTFVCEYRIPSGLEPGAKTVSVTVYDQSGASARKALTVGVGNAPAKKEAATAIPGPQSTLLLAAAGLLAICNKARRRESR